VMTTETKQMWGTVTGTETIHIAEGGRFYYSGSTVAPAFTGASNLANIQGTYFQLTDLPVITSQGMVWDSTNAGWTFGLDSAGAGALVAGYHASANSQPYAIALGPYAKAESAGEHVESGISADGSGVAGHSQFIRSFLGMQTTSASFTTLPVIGGSPLITLADYTSYTVRIDVTAVDVATGNTASWTSIGAIKRRSGAASTAVVGSFSTTMKNDSGASAWQMAPAADTTNGGLDIGIVGAASTTINWHGVVTLTSMYGH
jgi:hypothetical protein